MGLPEGLITGRTSRLPGVSGDWKKQTAAVNQSHSGYERSFYRMWCELCPDLPRPWHDLEFAWPDRKWRFDFAWPDAMLAIEIDGAGPGGGRHRRREGFRNDAEKLRAATERGWRVLRFPTSDIKERPVQCIKEVASVLRKNLPCLQ